MSLSNEPRGNAPGVYKKYPESMKLTIITPSFNQGVYIEQTIKSVLTQDYQNVEHIVMDGGSADCTVNILKKYPHLKWVSEKDRGQADALNKGLARATGDIIGWINSDDLYESNIFGSVMEHFQDPGVMWIIGNLTYQFEESNERFSGRSPVVTLDRLVNNPDIVRQQPTFFRKVLLEQAGGWNPAFFMVMDFDLWMRLSKLSSPKMVSENWAYFRWHALQKTSSANTLRQMKELIAVLKREQVPWTKIWSLRLRKMWANMKGRLKDLLLRTGVLNSRYRSRPLRVKLEK